MSLDIIYCILAYGARPKDYMMFKFYKFRGGERNKFVTFYRHRKMMAKMDREAGEGKYHIVDNKEDEYAVYGKFIHRDWIIVRAEDDNSKIENFVKTHPMIIAKPTDSTFGRGVMKVSNSDESAISTLLENRTGHTYILEECLENCDELKKLNPSSLNTIRAFTHIAPNGELEIFTIQLRVGTPGMIVDNWGAGGVVYNIDVETGIIDRAGIDKHQKPYLFHPGSNVKMIGFEIPRYKELTEYILALASELPKAKVVGWDIAITKDGIDFIEMNCPGGHDIMQAFGTPYYQKYLY